MTRSNEPPLSEEDLDALFIAAQDATPVPSGEAMARWVADAEAMAQS